MMRDDYDEYDRQFKQNREHAKKSKEQFAKNQVKHIVKTSILTTAVGALADVEKLFGDLWGLGKDYRDLTPEQKDMREQWLDIRDSILERSSNGIKLSFRELERLDIRDYNSKKYNVIIKNKENRDGR